MVPWRDVRTRDCSPWPSLGVSVLCVALGDGPFDDVHLADSHMSNRLFNNFAFVEHSKYLFSRHRRSLITAI